ncbi:MAG: CSLREA domain-containing protein, partial [Candidatus Hydrogenedentes bacterium]|nr:CSLREA domain-containing protein [Candidatus Hydrogenedentota bacterium]
MKRAAVVFVFCLLVSNLAFATGDIYLVDAGGLKYDISTDATNLSYTTCTSYSTWTSSSWYTCTWWSSSCWWTWTSWLTWTSSCWTVLTDYVASGAANEASYTHTVSASTISGGLTPQPGIGDAFDSYNHALIERTIEVPYVNNGPASVEANGRQIAFPPQMVDTLEFSRKVFVPEDDTFCRWLNIVTNTGSDPEKVLLIIEGNLGSDGNTLLVDTSNGNTTAETDDTWLVTMQDFAGGTSSDPRLGHILQGGNAEVGVDSVDLVNGNDSTRWEYGFVLEPGETGIIMNFVTGQPTVAAAREKAIELSQPMGVALDYMTPEEKSAVLNFELTAYTTLTVNSLADDETAGDGLVTLREAINAANTGLVTDLGQVPGPITKLDMSGLAGALVLADSLPTVTSNVIIEGPESPKSDVGILPSVMISGSEARRIMSAVDANLTLKNLTLAEGNAGGGAGASSNGGGGGGGALGAGGAVYVSGGAFKAVNVIFAANEALGGNGGAGDDAISANVFGGGGGGMGGNGDGLIGGGGGILGGLGGATPGEYGGLGGGGAGNESGGVGGAGGLGGGGGGGGQEPAGGVGLGGFGAGGGGVGAAGAEAGANGGSGGDFGGMGGSSVAGSIAGGGGGGGAGLGGAVYGDSCTMSFENCTFENNSAVDGTGGTGAVPVKTGTDGQGVGGAVFLNGTRAWAPGTSFTGNTATTTNPDTYGEYEEYPGVLSITLATGAPITGADAAYLVVFSHAVGGVDATDFLVQTTGTVAAGTPFVEGSGDTYTVTVPLGPSEGTVALELVDDGTIYWGSAPLGGPDLGDGDFVSAEAAVDNVMPNAPILEGDPTPPEDNILTWSWVSGGGGNGTYCWRINNGEWTETTELTVTQEAGYGLTVFEVRERDDAGNWSEPALWEVTIRQRLYVNMGSSAAEPDGMSWETAYASIGDAIDYAETDYVDIWVAAGTYFESVELPGHTRLYGGFAGTETE